MLTGCAGSGPGSRAGEPAPSARGTGLALANLAPLDAARALSEKVTADGAMTHLRAFADIAAANGGNRALGTPGYRASVDYVAGKLGDAGYRVHRQDFTLTRWAPEKTELRVAGAPVPADPLELSGATDGTLTAPVAVLPGPGSTPGLGCAATDFGAVSRGAVVVLTRGECRFGDKVRRAADKGAAAVIVVNNEPGPLDRATIGGADPARLPVVGVASEAAATLTDGARVALTVDTDVRRTPTQNVLAETVGGDADHVLMVGAHLDSVAAGPGINDNGTGSAAVLETALRLGAGAGVKNKVRFAFWAAEEEGLLGSQRYVDTLPVKERTKIARYLNFDMLGSPNGGYFINDGDGSSQLAGSVSGPAGSGAIEDVFTEYFAGRSITPGSSPFDGRSDYGPFIAKGIPSGGVDTGAEKLKTERQAADWGGTAGQPYDPNYHSAGDGLDNVGREIFAVTVPSVAWATGYFAVL